MSPPARTARATSADEERFEALYREQAPRVLAYARRRSPPDVAQEVVAETFVVAWRKLADVPEAPLPWLLAVARKTLANQRRSSERQEALVGRIGANERTRRAEPGGAEDLSARVAAALRRLPEKDRELLRLVAWDGLSAKEAAVVLGWSHVNCRVRLHRATRQLAAELTGRGREEQ